MGIWHPKRLKLFVSHTTKHKGFVEELKLALMANGISAFVAHSDIEPTADWQKVIEKALTTADALAAYLTEDFHQSKWTDQEIGVAVGRKIIIIPVKAGLDPYGFIGKYQAYAGERKTATEVAKAITRILLKHKSTALKMSGILVGIFEGSNAWAEAKANMAMLEESTVLDDDLVVRLKKAVKKNRQIHEAFGVCERVEKLIEKRSSSAK